MKANIPIRRLHSFYADHRPELKVTTVTGALAAPTMCTRTQQVC